MLLLLVEADVALKTSKVLEGTSLEVVLAALISDADNASRNNALIIFCETAIFKSHFTNKLPRVFLDTVLRHCRHPRLKEGDSQK